MVAAQHRTHPCSERHPSPLRDAKQGKNPTTLNPTTLNPATVGARQVTHRLVHTLFKVVKSVMSDAVPTGLLLITCSMIAIQLLTIFWWLLRHLSTGLGGRKYVLRGVEHWRRSRRTTGWLHPARTAGGWSRKRHWLRCAVTQHFFASARRGLGFNNLDRGKGLYLTCTHPVLSCKQVKEPSLLALVETLLSASYWCAATTRLTTRQICRMLRSSRGAVAAGTLLAALVGGLKVGVWASKVSQAEGLLYMTHATKALMWRQELLLVGASLLIPFLVHQVLNTPTAPGHPSCMSRTMAAQAASSPQLQQPQPAKDSTHSGKDCRTGRGGSQESIQQPSSEAGGQGSPMFYEQQVKQFCQCHALNALFGRHILSGEVLLGFLTSAKASAKHDNTAAALHLHAGQSTQGNFCTAQVNYWLVHNTQERAHLRSLGTAIPQGSGSDDFLQRLRAHNVQRPITAFQLHWDQGSAPTQGPHGHVICVRQHPHTGVWYALDSEKSLPLALTDEMRWGTLRGTMHILFTGEDYRRYAGMPGDGQAQMDSMHTPTPAELVTIRPQQQPTSALCKPHNKDLSRPGNPARTRHEHQLGGNQRCATSRGTRSPLF